MLYSHCSELQKDNPQPLNLGENKRCPIRFRLFLRRMCSCQYCRFVHQKFWCFFDEVTCFYFLEFCCCRGFWGGQSLFSFFWTLWDELRVGPVCTWTQTICQCRKKTQKEAKSEKKNKKKKWLYLFRFCSFYQDEKKNTDTEQSGQRIKSLFFILYIWKSRFQYVALLCCTNQMCLWHFSNLIYFTVFFVFLLHH